MNENDDPQPAAESAANEAAPSQNEVFEKVAVAMASAAEAMKSGASDARTAAARAVPNAQLALSKTIYSTSYYLSYGVVFPALLLTSLIPKNNALVHGMLDGARAAHDAVDNLRAERAEPPAEQSESPAAAPA
ncbi:MAG TPA: hypothetical protein VG125_30790 [Pirellulales bacterium]|jgi:hypothetical protein|nr:hypothetical protein [Pirellulales bacterium]